MNSYPKTLKWKSSKQTRGKASVKDKNGGQTIVIQRKQLDMTNLRFVCYVITFQDKLYRNLVSVQQSIHFTALSISVFYSNCIRLINNVENESCILKGKLWTIISAHAHALTAFCACTWLISTMNWFLHPFRAFLYRHISQIFHKWCWRTLSSQSCVTLFG